MEGKPYSRNTVKAISFRAGQTSPGSLQRKPFSIIRDKYFKPVNDALDPSLKPTRDKTRWPSAKNNDKPAEVRHLKRANDEKSVHLQVLQILHIMCFTDINSETKTHFFLVKFLNSTSDYINQKRQVFEFLIEGALRELISPDSLSSLVQSQWK